MKTVKRKACEGKVIEVIEVPKYEKERYNGARYDVGDLFEVQSVSKTSVRVFGRERNNNMPLVMHHGEIKINTKKRKAKEENTNEQQSIKITRIYEHAN